LLERVDKVMDKIVAAAPVDSEGRFLDDGTYSDDQELLGIPVRVVTLDARSLDSMYSDLHWDIRDVLAAPAMKIDDGWHVSHRTVTAVANALDRLGNLHDRVHATAPQLAGEVSLPQGLTGIIAGATDIPASLEDVDDWPTSDLPRALRALAELNYIAHRTEGHGKSWEPGIKILRQGPQWQVTLITYQFDGGYAHGRDHVFTGTWDGITEAIHAATAKLAQHHELTPAGGDLEADHPLARLSKFELLNLPSGVELYLGPGHLTASVDTPGVRRPGALGAFRRGAGNPDPDRIRPIRDQRCTATLLGR
jgi:hypothetical protein